MRTWSSVLKNIEGIEQTLTAISSRQTRALAMGLCSSCCGRRRKHNNNERSERTPLLSQVTDPAHIRTVSQTAVDVVAATKAGKYPSQDQVNRVVRALLKWDILKEHRYSKVSPSGRRIVGDVRSICEQLLVFGLEKNGECSLCVLCALLTQSRRR